MSEDFWRSGVVLRHGWLGAAECDGYVAAVRELECSDGLPRIERTSPGRPLCYKVVDGRRIESVIRDIDILSQRVIAELEDVCGTRFVPISDPVAARNVNVTPPGGTYRWHYDRNAVTTIVYLNEVKGGETELFPNYRLLFRDGRCNGRLRRSLDLLLRLPPVRFLFGRRRLVVPSKGLLVIMRGDHTLHSVRRVDGDEDRMTIVLGWDFPGAHHARFALDRYLYETTAVRGDPNYLESAPST